VHDGLVGLVHDAAPRPPEPGHRLLPTAEDLLEGGAARGPAPWLDAGRLLVMVDTFQWPAAARGHAGGTVGHVGATAAVWDAEGRLLASGGQQMLCRPVPPPVAG
jgi:hypothetical protein